MIFAGREKEKTKIIKELQRGRNIILTGKYGIGRTCLIHHVASLLPSPWRFIFVSFNQTPGQTSKTLMKELGMRRTFSKTGIPMGYKSRRYRIAGMAVRKGLKIVIVLDDIARLTTAKKVFLRHLILEQHFQFIAIVEHFLPEKDLFDLKTQLFPATHVTLGYLDNADVEHILQNHSRRYRLEWDDRQVRQLAALSGGYPLGITEMLKYKRESL